MLATDKQLCSEVLYDLAQAEHAQAHGSCPRGEATPAAQQPDMPQYAVAASRRPPGQTAGPRRQEGGALHRAIANQLPPSNCLYPYF